MKTNKRSLSKSMKKFYLAMLISAIVALIIFIALGVVYINVKNNVLLIILGVYALAFIAYIIIGILFLIRFTENHFVKNVLNISKQNLNAVRNEKLDLEKFPNANFEEYEEMNKIIDELAVHDRNVTIVNSQINYSKIPLDYVDAVNHVINYDSLKKYLREIIYCSQAFRNVLVSLSYALEGDEQISEEENARIISTINSIFDYDNLLISKNNNEYLVYIPCIDSTKQLSEEIELLISKSSVAKTRVDGSSIIIGKVSAVIYPYSEIDEMFADLDYAKRQESDSAIYFPTKENRDPNHSLLQTSMNLNQINRTINQINSLKVKTQDLDADLKAVEKALAKLSCYISVDECGLILFDKTSNCYISSLKINISGDQVNSFASKKAVDKRIIDGFNNAVDINNVFYFSSRNKVSSKIGEIVDLLGVISGFIYKIEGEDYPIGFVYFVNKAEKPFKIDSYMYESLTVVSSLIGSHLKQFFIARQIKDYRQREEEALKLSNLFSYSIDRETFEITDFSQSFADTFNGIKKGDICYKKLHGLDQPCSRCPLLSGNKMISTIDDCKYETSLYLATTEDNKIGDLLMTELESSLDSTARYDKDYLVKSCYAFANRLKDLFYTNSKGYLLILMIDNATDLVDQLDNEGYANYMRKFTKAISDRVENSSDVFLFKDDTLAILYPEMGRMDIISHIEKIYDLSKENLLGLDVQVECKIAYEAVKYPQSFPSSNDIINYINRNIYARNKTKFRSDILHLDESDYFRQASRKEYIFSILDDSVNNKTFNVKLQPMIRDFDKSITGAELLIRLSDAYKESMINTNELIQVAADNNKIGAISDFLMNFIGDIYKKFGHSVFKTHGFSRLSLNTDYSYFTDAKFFDKVAALKSDTYFPKDFLAFEINEREVYEHADKFKDIFEGIKRADIALVCDQYTGEFVSIEKLKSIGFTEIKISRSMVKDIEINEEKLNNIRIIVANAHAYDIRSCLVGIENKEQYMLIKGDQSNVHMQGYYFYKPLDVLELMEAIRTNNN